MLHSKLLKSISIGLVIMGLALFVLKFYHLPSQPTTSSFPTTSSEEIQDAEDSLKNFFQSLNQKKYQDAVEQSSFESGPSDWELLQNFSPSEDRQNKVLVLKNYCEAVMTCFLEIKTIEFKSIENDEYTFEVQFFDQDGNLYQRGPCCGATEEEMPPQDRFEFTVKKISDQFKVITPPLYVP